MTRTVLCLLLTLAACGGGDAPATSTTPATGEEPAAPSASDPVESPSAPAAAGCEQEVALACADGFADGCLSKLTLVHVCVAKSEEKAGPPPCKQEIARQCPDGQVDACLSSPPMAANHVCVLAPK